MFLPLQQSIMPGSETNNFGGVLFQAVRSCYPETPYFILELRIVDSEVLNPYTQQPGKWWIQYLIWQVESVNFLLHDQQILAHRLHVVLPVGVPDDNSIRMIQVDRVSHVKSRDNNGNEFCATIFFALNGRPFVFCEDVPADRVTEEHILHGQTIYSRSEHRQNLD